MHRVEQLAGCQVHGHRRGAVAGAPRRFAEPCTAPRAVLQVFDPAGRAVTAGQLLADDEAREQLAEAFDARIAQEQLRFGAAVLAWVHCGTLPGHISRYATPGVPHHG